jgi:mono/diheme cytochrome c family protein
MVNRFKSALFLSLSIIFIASPCFGAQTGQALYKNHCARCHGDDGGGKGPAHTMQRPWPRDFKEGRFKFRSTPLFTLPTLSDIKKTISHGNLRTSMPPYENILTPDEIHEVALYVLQMAGESGLPDGTAQQIPYPDWDDTESTQELILKGKALYNKFQCASCHGENAKGLGPLAGGLRDEDGFWITHVDLTDPLSYGGGAQISDIYMRLRTGMDLSPMISYADVLDEDQAKAIAFYVKSLQIKSEERQLIKSEEWRTRLSAQTRGEYMVRAMSCALCHNSYDAKGFYNPDLYMAGGVGIHIPGLGTFPTKNITSHPEDGLGDWTQEEIVRAVTTGFTPDRRLEAFAMPWVFFSHLTPEDAMDIAHYVKHLPAKTNRVPDRIYQPMWKRLFIRIRQLLGFEKGRLEYPPGNTGQE